MSEHPSKRIRRALMAITAAWNETLQPSQRGSGGHVSAAAFAPLPVSADILDKRAMACSRLAGWCLVVITDRDLHTEHLSGLDIHAMADLLHRHSDWLGDHEAAGDIADELEASAADLTGITRPHRRDWVSLGPCPLIDPLEDPPTPCGGTIRAYPDCDPYCDHCRTEAVTSWWEYQQFPGRDTNRLFTAPELVDVISRAFGQVVVESTIRQWVTRGIIETSGHDDEGRNLYDRAGVVYALARRSVIAS